MVDVFIYDSLMKNKNYRNNFFGRDIRVFTNEVVMGYHKFKIDKNGSATTCALKSVPEDGISGLVAQLSKDELLKLDELQTSLYSRRLVKSTSERSVWIYIVNDKTYKEKSDYKKI